MKSLLFYFCEVNVIRNKFNITFTWRCSDYTAWKFPQKQLMAEELVWLWNHRSVFRILHILGWYLCFIFHAAGCLSFSFQWMLLSFFFVQQILCQPLERTTDEARRPSEQVSSLQLLSSQWARPLASHRLSDVSASHFICDVGASCGQNKQENKSK